MKEEYRQELEERLTDLENRLEDLKARKEEVAKHEDYQDWLKQWICGKKPPENCRISVPSPSQNRSDTASQCFSSCR